MNHLECAADLLNDAASLIAALTKDTASEHRPALRRTAIQLRLYREAIKIATGSREVSLELALDMDVASEEGVLQVDSFGLLDEYVGCRLETTEAAVLSIQNRYLESERNPMVMIGKSLYEAEHWIATARRLVKIELDRLARPTLRPAA